MIHDLDPNHPVGVCNAGYAILPYLKKYASKIQFVGMNAYMGYFGFGTLWGRIKNTFDRPILITEYGVDCYDQNKQEVNEAYQALYHLKNWNDIVQNSFGMQGKGNAIGGVAYNWIDRWWLCGDWKEHDTDLGSWKGPSLDGWMNDEWLGFVSQGDGSDSPFYREPRMVYDAIKRAWRRNQ